MKTMICVKGEWFYAGVLEPIQKGRTYLTQCGTDTFIGEPYKKDARCRHRLTPVDPSVKHAVAMKIGLEAYDT